MKSLIIPPSSTAQINRRKALKTMGATALAALLGLAPDQRIIAEELNRATDPHKAILENTIKTATKSGYKFDYDSLRNHPSPFLADIVLRLLQAKTIDTKAAHLALYKSSQNINLYTDPTERSYTADFHIADLIHQADKTKGYADPQLGKFFQLRIDQKPAEAHAHLPEALKKRGLL